MGKCENGTEGCLIEEAHYPSECVVPFNPEDEINAEDWNQNSKEQKGRELAEFLGPDYVPRRELCRMLGIKEKSYLEGRSRGKYVFPEYRLGSHVFVRHSEILESMGGDAK